MAVKAIYATGRRKTSSARVFLFPRTDSNSKQEGSTPKEGDATEESLSLIVNDTPYEQYFPRPTTQLNIRKPFEITERLTKYQINATVAGGGKSGQAGAVVHALARAIERAEPELRGSLKKAGLLTRDPRAVERKKPGRHKARKSTQFSKR